MKKILSMLVVVSIVVLSAMGAFAADYLPDDNGRYTVVVDGLQAGEMYGMVAIKGTQASQITEANIVYIDQATADSNGTISFTSFGTMGAAPDSEDFVEATVFVGGAGLSSATSVGTLKAAAAPEPEVIPVTAVTLSEATKELEIGGTFTLTLVATVTPDDATDKTVTWASDNATVAEVVDGVVTAKAAGTATITAKAGDKSATCVVTVKAAPEVVEGMPGDVDGDEELTVVDALLICRKIAGHDVEVSLDIADVDDDGELTVVDALLICRKIAGHNVDLQQYR